MKMARRTKGMVTIIAYILRKVITSSAVLLALSKKAGTNNPPAIDIKVVSTVTKVTKVSISTLNQFIVILLALFMMTNPLPPARKDPNRQR